MSETELNQNKAVAPEKSLSLRRMMGLAFLSMVIGAAGGMVFGLANHYEGPKLAIDVLGGAAIAFSLCALGVVFHTYLNYPYKSNPKY